MKKMIFMGREFKSGNGGETWDSYSRFPLISFGLCVDGTWFGSLSFRQRINGPAVRGCASLQTAKEQLRKKVRSLRTELDSLK
jgi:hypothetical protein